jgi:hypothetical protein
VWRGRLQAGVCTPTPEKPASIQISGRIDPIMSGYTAEQTPIHYLTIQDISSTMKTISSIGVVLLLCVGVSQRAAHAQPGNQTWSEEERRLLIEGLDRTRDLLQAETADLTTGQWQFKEVPDRWSIAEVVEHLQLQEDMYFRELYLISQVPEMPELRERVRGKEAQIMAYSTDPEAGIAAWYLQPEGRWSSGPEAMRQLLRSREKVTDFVRNTNADLRLHFTFRDYYPGSDGLWAIRDLHQLLLTTIAHTERHVNQIKRIKEHSSFPRE